MGRRKKTESGFNYASYYGKNKEDINRRRRERYRANPELRKRVKKRNEKYYEENKTERSDRRIVKSKKGVFFSMGVFSKSINRKPQTVREYHRDGVIPDPLHFDTRGWRLYTRSQTLLAKQLFEKYDQKEIPKEELIILLREGWKDGEKSS